jgi:anti-anti-sigma factor
MNIHTSIAGSTATLLVDGRFDFGGRQEFKAATENALDHPQVGDIVIDLRRADYIDSAALGMLLLLRDKAQALRKTVRLTAKAGVVCEVLQVAQFGKTFTLRVE